MIRIQTDTLRSTIAGILLMSATTAAVAAEGPTVLSEVTVTAERREASLQTTPVAVTALGGSELDRLQINSIRDLGTSTPSLGIAPNIASGSAITLSMRGNAEQNAAVLFSEGGVGLYVDGVYRRLTAAGFDLAEVERIEVLRGPQGTLFGRNTLAGAVNVITKRPGDEFEGNVEAGYGAYQTSRLRAYVAGPLSGNWSASLSAVYRDRSEGWMTDRISGKDVGTGDYFGGQGEVRYATDTFDASLKVFYAQASSDGVYASPVAVNTLERAYSKHTDVASASPTDGGKVVSPMTKNQQQGVDLNLSWKFGDMTLKSTTSYLDMPDDLWAVDFTAAQVAAFPPAGPYDAVPGTSGFFRKSTGDQEQFSQDLQLSGTAGSLDWTAGLYYYEEKTNQTFQDWFAGGFFKAVPAVHHLDASSQAVYAQGRYAFTDRFSVVLGGRYTKDEKDLTGNKANGAGAPTDFASHDSFSRFTGKAGVEFKVSDTIFTYATFSQGFKSGTYDYYSAAPGIAQPLDPELVDSFEVGAKLELLDRRMRLNLALFDTKYTDLVVGTIEPNVGLINTNAGTERVTGLEAELTWRASDILTIYASGALLDPRWTELSAGALSTGVKMSDAPPLSYEKQGSAGFSVSTPVGGNVRMDFNASVNYIGEQYQNVAHLNSPTVLDPARTTADTSLQFSSGQHSLTLAVKNLTDNTDQVVASDFSTFLYNNTTAWTPAEPRTWELRYRYDLK
ncbi:MAG: TonB-dependent receptor [Gammaproteobacteria bacterium]|nr:TonB-dependent receptor [Gammaproteobacteria bacterium]